MASWKETTPTFNPYVQQNPVETMAKVGMEKQRQYQEGYQKIQNSVDKVAGLDVIRDVDKQHLQSKLDTLGGKLRTVAAGDFSNFQMTNSIAGMTSDIIDDEAVQNAVSSTMRIKSETAKRKGLEAQGLTDANNDAYFSGNILKFSVYSNPPCRFQNFAGGGGLF